MVWGIVLLVLIISLYIGRKRFKENKVRTMVDILSIEAAVFGIASFEKYGIIIAVCLSIRLVYIIVQSLLKERQALGEKYISRKIIINITQLLTLICIISLIFINRYNPQNRRNIKIIKAIEKYYEEKNVENINKVEVLDSEISKGNNYILVKTEFDKETNGLNLFLFDENYKILKKAEGIMPISMCFSVNKLNYNGDNIIFGSFNDSTWIPKEDIRKPVTINTIEFELSNNGKLDKNVSGKEGYIMILSEESNVDDINLFNEKKELQSNLDDLKEYGEVFNETTFD